MYNMDQSSGEIGRYEIYTETEDEMDIGWGTESGIELKKLPKVVTFGIPQMHPLKKTTINCKYIVTKICKSYYKDINQRTTSIPDLIETICKKWPIV